MTRKTEGLGAEEEGRVDILEFFAQMVWGGGAREAPVVLASCMCACFA